MYRRQEDHWGYVPNYAKVFSHRPEVMARWGRLLAEIKRPMDRRTFELATFVAAQELKNRACTLAHGKALREFFTDEEIVAIAKNKFGDILTDAEAAFYAVLEGTTLADLVARPGPSSGLSRLPVG